MIYANEREPAQRHNQKKKIREYEAMHNIKISPAEMTEELLSEIMNAKKTFESEAWHAQI